MIKKIKWDKFNMIGNLELDFTKEDGTTYNTIILAGENGTGKTTILESLAEFLSLGSFEQFDYINYIANNKEYTIEKDKNSSDDGARFGYHNRKEKDKTEIEKIRTGKVTKPKSIEEDKNDIRHYGVSYSKARSGFNTRRVTSTTLQQLDENKYEGDNSDDFTSIKQLIVDIDAQDKSEWMRITKSGDKKTFEEFQQESKLFRFEKSFNDFFDTLKYKDIDDSSTEEKKIVFEKNGKEISIDRLSTGEKQIVFRGAHLLKNSNSISGGVVLIDEPELSMHPKWQQKILEYYRSLFTENGKQNVQMIIATHSEYVLRAALEDRDNVLIIILHDNNGIIEANRITAPTVLPTITSAETNYLAFGIISPDYHIELYGYLQNKTNNFKVKLCDDYIVQNVHYNPQIHEKVSSYKATTYKTLPTYIRNLIDHPSSTQTYTQKELETSIKLLIELCK